MRLFETPVEDPRETLLEKLRASRSLPFQPHSITSKKAATSMEGGAASIRYRVLTEIRNHGPLSDQQLAHRLGLAENTCRPRRIELLKAGLIEKAGTTKTKSGRSAVRWRVL